MATGGVEADEMVEELVEGEEVETEDGRRALLVRGEDGQDAYYVVIEQPGEDESADDSMLLGATATARTDEEPADAAVTAAAAGVDGPVPQGMKGRRSRVYGTCRCPECGQSFVNSARLERHLAVHQVFGSYLCPLCGKTYKYEYNLFYHWRRTCRDLNELMDAEERRAMDVNALRQLVDEVTAKKAELGSLGALRQPRPLPPADQTRTDVPAARRGEACPECGVVVLGAHLARHMAIHRGEAPVDSRGVAGGYYCDLCGLMFRQHFNLIKHWRSSCPEIQVQLNPEVELTMDDETLKDLVADLLQRKRLDDDLLAPVDDPAMIAAGSKGHDDVVRVAMGAPQSPPPVAFAGRTQEVSSALPTDDDSAEQTLEQDTVGDEVQMATGEPEAADYDADDTGGAADGPSDYTFASRRVGGGGVRPSRRFGMRRRLAEGESSAPPEHEDVDVTTVEEREAAAAAAEAEARDWPADAPLFADDYDDEDADDYAAFLAAGGDGGQAVGPLGLPTGVHTRAKWSMVGGPVQCPECFRSFANAGRLERHLAGFHASYGTQHCILCGNRFKYDYNLLYHYRRSCPYTKAFIDRDVREQMDAPSLRKLVRSLAQKEVRLAPQVEPPPRLPSSTRDAPRPRLAMRYPSNQPPAHLLVPRPGLPDGKTCPVCGIIFYGSQAVDRHVRAAHPDEWDEWQAVGGYEELARVHVEEADDGDAPVLLRMDDGGEDDHDLDAVEPQQLGRLRRVSAPPRARRGQVDPTLESSIATFLSEMKEEAGRSDDGGARRGRRGRGRGRATFGRRPAARVAVDVEPVEQFEDAPQDHMAAGHVRFVDDFEEQLDVEGVDVEGRGLEEAPPLLDTAEYAEERRESGGRPQRKTRRLSGAEAVPTCDQCGKTFVSNAHLVRHMRSHKPQQRADCPLCGVSFRQEDALRTHWRSGRCAPLRGAAEERRLRLAELSNEDVDAVVAETAADCHADDDDDAPRTSPPRKSARLSGAAHSSA